MIRVEGLHVNLPGFALQDLNLDINRGDYFILVGPSASGKTVLLETIAGIRSVTAGKVWIGNRDITALEPEKRMVGMVYQDCALFPHLSVEQNIVFGPKVRKEQPRFISNQMDRLISLFQIESLLHRKPVHLSGGEKQKVALARALINNPEVLLLDEPLGALDPQTREAVRREIGKIHTELGITIIHVTHDFEEAVMMGTHIAVIDAGMIRQIGPADEIFRHPKSEFVARFTMAGNIFSGQAARNSSGTNTFVVEDARFVTDSLVEGPCQAAIRPETVLLSKNLPADRTNVFSSVVTRIVNKGSIIEVTVDLPPTMTCVLTRYDQDQMNLTVGDPVYLSIPASSVHLFTG